MARLIEEALESVGRMLDASAKGDRDTFGTLAGAARQRLEEARGEDAGAALVGLARVALMESVLAWREPADNRRAAERALDLLTEARRMGLVTAEVHAMTAEAYSILRRTAGTLSKTLYAQRAKTAAERALALDPHCPSAHLAMGAYLLFTPVALGGSPLGAREHLTHAVEGEPRRFDYRALLVRACRACGDGGEAVRQMEELRRRSPWMADWLEHEGRDAGAVRQLEGASGQPERPAETGGVERPGDRRDGPGRQHMDETKM